MLKVMCLVRDYLRFTSTSVYVSFYNSVYCSYKFIPVFIQGKTMGSLLDCMLDKWLKETEQMDTSSSHKTITAIPTLMQCCSHGNLELLGVPQKHAHCRKPCHALLVAPRPSLLMFHTFTKSLWEVFKESETTNRLKATELAYSGGILMCVICTKCTLNREAEQLGLENGTGTRLSEPQSNMSSFHLARLSHEAAFLLHFPFMTLQINDSPMWNKQKASEHL